MEELHEEVIANIRACLISTKGSCDLRQLKSDYRMLMGCEIPYRKLNYDTLEDFIVNVKSLAVTKGPGGQIFIDAKSSNKTSHIADLVDRQKTTKKKTRMPLRTDSRKPWVNRAPDKKWRPKSKSSNWKSSYENTPKLAAVSHNQFINIPVVAKKPNLPPRFNRQLSAIVNNNNENSEIKDLRQLLNSKKTVSFESDSSSSTSSERVGHSTSSERMGHSTSSERVGHSTKTNLATLMHGIPRKHSPPVLNPIQVENLKNNSLAAVDVHNPIWDSWTSSDDNDSKFPSSKHKQVTFEFTGDSIVDLYSFTGSRKLGDPSFKIVSRKTKPHKPTLYDCQIKVGTHKYSSYPVDFLNELTAKQYAAKLALDDLTTKYGKRKSLLLSTEQDILDRVPPIVEKHYHGIWNWQLEADYADMFQEQLPMNWLDIIDTSPKISVEAFLDNKYVLRYCKPEDLLQKGKKFAGVVADVSVASNTVSFNEDGTLLAVITCAVSAKEIWCRQIDTEESDAFHVLMQNFERAYTHTKSFEECAKNIVVGGYYAAYYDNNWYRVRVFEVKDKDVNCFLIDYGDELVIDHESIYNLKREFAKEQAQAFICRLAGLEELYEVSASSEHLLSLLGKTVQVESDSVEQVLAKDNPNDPISVILYDIERNVSINEELISLITLESASPTLNKTGVTEAYVCHVESNGDVYVQTNPISFYKLDSLLIELETTVLEKNAQDIPAVVTPENSKDRLYLAKCNKVGHWYRVKITDWSPDKKYAQIYFVDYGNFSIITVKKETLYAVDELDDIINQFPEQAMQVRMVIENIPTNFVEKVKELMPRDQPVLLKYIETDSENVPCVKFFKRLEPSNILVSISDNISFESEQTKGTNPNKPEKLQRLISLNQFEDGTTNKNVPSSGILKSPTLPQIGQYFDVVIPCAVNPWNFFVQPYDSHEKLAKLMTALQEAYGNVIHSPLQIDDIKAGNIYASKHDDGQWYRTSVIKIIHSGSISVFYCDFGYYANLTLQQLIPLSSQFLELPYQAIKAKLTGIQPKQTKWTMEDCKYFQKLVCRKSFVSVLTAIEKDELYRLDTVLNLKIIDTSTDNDVYIDQVLVRRGIAVEAV